MTYILLFQLKKQKPVAVNDNLYKTLKLQHTGLNLQIISVSCGTGNSLSWFKCYTIYLTYNIIFTYFVK